MTRNEAIEILESVSFFAPSHIDVDTALDTAIEALDKPLPKPHERLMHWDTARRIIDSPRSKSQMLAVLDGVPPVEAIEHKRGKWQVYYDEDSPQDGIWECSICGYIRLIDSISSTNFCPNCGADMRGDYDEKPM